MKRFSSIIVGAAALVLAMAPLAFAESYAGFRLGANMASMTGDDADQIPDSRLGFTGGGFIGFDSGKHLGFRADVLYTMKGGKTSTDETLKLDYLETAMLLTVRASLTQRFTVRGFIGPVFGLFVNAESTEYLPDSTGDPTFEIDHDLGEIVEHFEISATFGVELDIRTGPYFTIVEARYTQGSRVFEDIGIDGEPLDLKVSNSGIGLMAGLMIPF